MKEEITAIIIDDEPKARNLLREMLKEYCPQVQVVADCQDLPNGVKGIRKLNPQLVFLDIEMPGHSGLELLDFFNEDEVQFSIIFTTAYHEYAIQAFRMNAVDYLTKPVEPEELVNAVARYTKRRGISNAEQVRSAAKQLSPQRIAVPLGSNVRFIEPAEILYLKADNNYTEIHLADGSKLIVSRTLKTFEGALNTESGFFRCQKSYLINMSYAVEYSKSDGGYIIMKNKAELPISPDKVAEFLEQVNMIKR